MLVVRISDPVHISRPGEISSFPLYYFRKQLRLNAGSWIFSGAGGRAEILYGDSSRILLFDVTSGVVGSASRGEPMFFFEELSRASVTMENPEQVRLLGGAILACTGGPFVIERIRPQILRVRNRSEHRGRVAYLEEVFLLDPGDVIDLPLLDEGTAPREALLSFQTLGEGPGQLEVRGSVERIESAAGVRLRATGEHEIRANGLRLRLDRGDDVQFFELIPDGSLPSAANSADERAGAMIDESADAGTDEGDSQ